MPVVAFMPRLMILRNPLILPVFVPTFLIRLGSGLLIPILPLYAKSFDISYVIVGFVLAADGFGHLIGDLPAAVVVNRIGRKATMLLGVLTVALCGAGLFVAPSVLVVFILRFVGGLGGALWDISRYAYLTDITATHQRGRALSVFGGISRIGTFAGPGIGGYIAAVTSVKGPFLVFGVITLMAAVVAAIAVESSAKRISPPQHGHLRHIFGIFRAHSKNLITAGTGQLFAQTIRSGRYFIIPLYGAEVLGLGYEQIGLILSISGAVDMAMFYPAGVIMDRLGRKFANVPSFALQAIGMALIPATQVFAPYLDVAPLLPFGLITGATGGFMALLLAACVIGFGNGLSSGAMMTLGADLAPRDGLSAFLGLWRLIGDAGRLSGPACVGSIADLLGLSPATLAIACIGLSAAGIFLFLVPETLKK